MILGVGIDVVDVPRFRRLLDKHGERFRRRVFTAAELDLAAATTQAELTLAARFAAKEAAMKALGTGWSEDVTFRDLEIGRDSRGAPRLTLRGGAKRQADDLGVRRCHVSLSHVEAAAVAVVVLEADSPARE